MAERLSTVERVRILSQRLINLKNGSGKYSPGLRAQAIKATTLTLWDAYGERRGERK